MPGVACGVFSLRFLALFGFVARCFLGQKKSDGIGVIYVWLPGLPSVFLSSCFVARFLGQKNIGRFLVPSALFGRFLVFGSFRAVGRFLVPPRCLALLVLAHGGDRTHDSSIKSRKIYR